MALYWQLPNVPDAKYCYFQEIDFGTFNIGSKRDVFPIKPTVEQALVENGKERGVHLDRSYSTYFMGSYSLAAFFGYLLYLAA